MNRRVIIIFIIISILILSTSILLYFKRDGVKLDDTALKRNEFVANNEESLKDDFKIKGTHVRNGGTHSIGETVLTYGMAVKLSQVGLREGLATGEEQDMKFMTFKLELYNINTLPYELKFKDIVLHYGKKDESPVEQPITKEAYANWKYIDDAFKIAPIGTSTMRSGYIFFPVKDSIQEGGFVRINIQGIPIDFKF